MTGDRSIPTAGTGVNAAMESSHSPVARHPDAAGAGPLDQEERAARDIAEEPAVEGIKAAGAHLETAAAGKGGLAEAVAAALDEARKLITALAALVTAAAPEVGNQHARPLRDGLRTLQLAFKEPSVVPDPPGEGPGERWTGTVS